MKKIYTIMFVVSMILVAISVFALVKYGLNFGVDFRGGSVIEFTFTKNRPSAGDLTKTLAEDKALEDIGVSLAGDRNAIVRTRVITEIEHQQVIVVLTKAFPDSGLQEVRFDSIGPVIGDELRAKSVQAIVVVLVAIAIYITFVFRKLGKVLSPWVTSFATMVALAHDVLLPVGVFALLGHFRDVEIGAVFVAAILTILGYSISDTVIVFDRVRENIIRGGTAKDSFSAVVHKSIMQTIVRSLNTNFTTLLSLVSIYFFGGDSIRYFALALIIGIAAGAYSSIFVASPLLVWLSRDKRR